MVSLKLLNTPMDADVTSILLDSHRRENKTQRGSQLEPKLKTVASNKVLAKQTASNDDLHDLHRTSKTG